MTKKNKNDTFSENRAKFLLSDEWYTPKWIIDDLKSVRQIVLDPFGSLKSAVGAKVTWIYPEKNGLLDDWNADTNPYEYGIVFSNPPFSMKGEFTEHWVRQTPTFSAPNTLITHVAILPAKTEQPWFGKMLQHSDAAVFFKGRVAYDRLAGDEVVKGPQPPMGSVLFIRGEDAAGVCSSFEKHGAVVKLRRYRP